MPASFPYLGSFESTKIHGSGQDVLGTTRHDEFWRADLERLLASGIRELRYPVPWHRIEHARGILDWSWLDGPLAFMRDRGLQPILDPLHHVSFPDWLTDGFLHPEFPSLYARFIGQVASRYPWVDRYTVINEPLPTSVLCALTGAWYPHRRSSADFIALSINVARAICLGAAAVQDVIGQAQFVHIDSCESHRALDDESRDAVQHFNDRRFLFHDLVTGRVGPDHPLFAYLRGGGFTGEDESWFRDHAMKIGIVGLDYYAHSEIEWQWNAASNGPHLRFPCAQARGFVAVATDYIDHLRLPVMLSETNIGGTVRDRVTWLKFMASQAEQLAATADFRGFCWFPFLDATDWDSLCTVANHRLSPMGIWSLSDDDLRERQSSELSRWYAELASGRARSRDLPAYPLQAPLDCDLAGYRALMAANSGS